MTTFIDGPAKGIHLSLKRSPKWLRVVVGPSGKWDALDQLEDTPEENETIHLYRMHQRLGSAMVNYGGGRGGCYPIVEYKYAGNYADLELRHNWPGIVKDLEGAEG